MTNSSNSRPPKSSRRKPAREPATIDLKATVIDDGTQKDTVTEEGAKPVEEPVVVPTEGRTEEEVVAAPEATLDSGAGTDSIATEAPSQEPLAQEAQARETSSHESWAQEMQAQDTQAQEPPGQEPPIQEELPREPAPQVPPERRTSPAALVGAGLLGGLVGAGLLYGLQAWQKPEVQSDPRLAQLEQRVNALGQQPRTAAAPQGDTQALQGRIQALEDARGALDQRLQEIQAAAQQAGTRAEEALNRPLPQPPAPQDNTAALTDLSNRLSALEDQVRAGAQGATNAANAVQGLDRRIADQDSRLSDLGRQIPEQNRRASELDQRLADLSRKVTEGAQGAEAASQAGTRIVLAGRLSDSLRNGTPYADVLEGLKKAGSDQGKLAALEPFAQKGAPTPEALAQGFKPLAANILREERSGSSDWGDRLLHMMDRVVTVRPVNEPGSTGVSSIVARIEQALDRGNVADAVAAWDSLPEPARRLSEEWGRQAKARLAAEQAAQAASNDALAALNRMTQ